MIFLNILLMCNLCARKRSLGSVSVIYVICNAECGMIISSKSDTYFLYMPALSVDPCQPFSVFVLLCGID